VARRNLVLGITLLCLLPLSCRTAREDGREPTKVAVGPRIRLWVDLKCSKEGKALFEDYSILKFPDEQAGWALLKLDDDNCWVYGTLTRKGGPEAGLCDIRFRSEKPVSTGSRCQCIPGRYVLVEGRPTSKRCCEMYPDRVYCKPEDARPAPQSPDPTPEPTAPVEESPFQ
jgi:hypothetical protein